MNLHTITVENFLGAYDARIECSTPITLVAGLNAAGKSSIRDAVALALTADLGRVHLKKDAGRLVYEGQSAAHCSVTDANGDEWSVTITEAGKITDSHKGRETDPMLPYVLDAQRFARLSETERRAFLFGLMGVKITPADVKSRLMDRLFPKGCSGTDANRLDRVAPLLRAGFDAACAEAKTKATAAKGAWRAVTGETYGAVKAIDWKAAVPGFDQAALTQAQADLAAADEKVAEAQRKLGELQAEKKAHDAAQAKREGLVEAAGKLERAKAAAERAQTELHTWTADLAALKARAGAGPRVGLVHQLAAAIARVLPAWPNQEQNQAGWQEMRDALSAYETEHGPIGAAGDPEAAAKIPAAEHSVDLYTKALANAKRDITNAELADAALKLLDSTPWSAAPLTEATERLVSLQAAKAAAAGVCEKLRAARTAAEGAAKKTKESAEHHADVEAWTAIGDALSPDGIPAQLLAEALAPINDRLVQSAVDADWLPVSIGADMSITSDGRPYALLSESEKWRVDAMVAEAIAHLSNARLLVLDRADVLDLKGRADLFAWLDVLASNGEIDSALVFATLKGLPNDLPATVSAHWIEAGALAQPLKAAA